MRILVVDAQVLFAEGLSRLLEEHGHTVVARVADPAEAPRLIGLHDPDVVLLDASFLDGGDALIPLVADNPEVDVVLLAGKEPEEMLLTALRCGAQGCLPRDLPPDEFFRQLEGLRHGGPALTPALARRLLGEYARLSRGPREGDPEQPHLTDRETRILELLVSGTTSNRGLARVLGVSENTVKFHMRHILEKLHLHSRAEVVGFALTHGLVHPEENGT